MREVWRDRRQAVLRAIVRWCSRAYIAGPELADARAACGRFRDRGLANTVGYFNADDESRAAVAEASLATIAMLAGERFDAYVSIKAPALGFDADSIDRIAASAHAHGLGVHFDSHGPDVAEPTFAAVARAQRHGGLVGCTLPGRWLRSVDDARTVMDGGLRVRVVKGQWEDPQAPRRDARAGFLEVIDRLAGRAAPVAVATHDPALARSALERLQRAGTPCELELLYGLPTRASLRLASEMNVRARVYVPFGYAWMPYALRQIKRNPKMIMWVVRDGLAGFAGTR